MLLHELGNCWKGSCPAPNLSIFPAPNLLAFPHAMPALGLMNKMNSPNVDRLISCSMALNWFGGRNVSDLPGNIPPWSTRVPPAHPQSPNLLGFPLAPCRELGWLLGAPRGARGWDGCWRLPWVLPKARGALDPWRRWALPQPYQPGIITNNWSLPSGLI